MKRVVKPSMLIVTGAVLGTLVVGGFRSTTAIAQVPAERVRTCVGMAALVDSRWDDGANPALLRIWSDGSVEYTIQDGWDDGEPHFAQWQQISQ